MKRNCKICNNVFDADPFYTKKGFGKYCSIQCFRKIQYERKINNLKNKERLCQLCGINFVPKTHDGTKQYCSYMCSNTITARKQKKRAAETRICKQCKKEFTKARSTFPKNYGGKFCSRKCMGDSYAKNTSIHRWKVKVWNEFSKFIKKRDKWTCFTCGTIRQDSGMHAGHFVSRRHNNTLFDEKNVRAQCAGCNMFKKGALDIYSQKLILLYGLKEFNDLVDRGKIIKKFTRNELMDLYEKYKAK